ncbi:MAG TPA: hypothetical protein HA263_01825 [Methanoregulaceae archaeon]|nr:hypothetical protein [Methanoregulaceae archaeon]
MNGDVGDRPFRPVLEALEFLLEPGSVAELRALGRDGRVASGYFDDPALLADAAEPMDAAGEHRGIYVTLNPVNPALLARRANRVQSRLSGKDATTADADIVRRRWLPIDVDPVCPSGVSSTAEEHHEACATARRIREGLAELGWPTPVVADSGNGGHLLYRIDLPNDPVSTALVKGALAALDARFSTAAAKVDTANYNAARIWKCYGTVGRKGDSTKDRPHRRSAIVARPYEPGVVSVELLRALAAPLPETETPERLFAAATVPSGGAIDLRGWLDAHGIAVAAEKPWQGGMLYTLAQCPFSDAHADGAYAVQFPNGAIHAGCKHDSCGGGTQCWQELRARLEPAYAERPASPAIAAAAELADRPPQARGETAPSASAGGPAPSSPPSGEGVAPETPGPAAPSSPVSPEADPAVVAKARAVLEHGDPVQYFLDCFGGDHVGDETLARCLIMSIASQTVGNSRGLHVYVTGESGKGKSSGMTAMLRQVPKSYRLAERMSNKALYYSDDISPGTVLLLDDIALSEELQEVLKESTTKFTERVRMRVVNKDRKIQHCTIPERCAWWLANVSSLYDDQVLNRMLTCWVDDSEEQDREVFRRKLELEAREPDEAIGDRFELRVCREMWWLLKEQGLVYVQLPFARRIRMASIRNRRNPDVLFDMIRSNALINLYRRERRTLKDGRLTLVATEEDFDAAAALFVELHTTGGSLTSKFDRNEQLVLSLASHYRAERFDIPDLQRWTGWNYQKARRLMLGYDSRGSRYPGLLDKSPALSLVDQTVSEIDGEGRDVKRRSLVFTFNEEAYRKSQYAGQVWLEEAGSVSSFSRPDPADRPAERTIKEHPSRESPNETNAAERKTATFSRSMHTAGDRASGTAAPPVSTPAAERVDEGNGESGDRDESGANASTSVLSAHRPSAETAERPAIDPHRFVAIGDPEWEPCAVCGTKPSYFREKWVRGTKERRRLCKRCYGAAVEREQAKITPLPAVIHPSTMRRVTASVGRCSICDLAPATWTGEAGRLCDACYQREVRRGIEAGADLPAVGQSG